MSRAEGNRSRLSVCAGNGAITGVQCGPALAARPSRGHYGSMDEDRLIVFVRELVEIRADLEAQGEMISRLFALMAQRGADPHSALAAEKREVEHIAYSSAVLPDDDASDSLLAIMSRKARTKRLIFEIAEQMIDRSTFLGHPGPDATRGR